MHPTKDLFYNPGPGTYNPAKPVNKVMVGGLQRVKPNFGANAKRVDLIGRDVATMPFGDPTAKASSSPDKYQTNPESDKQKTMIL